MPLPHAPNVRRLQVALHQPNDILENKQGQAHNLQEAARGLPQKGRCANVVGEEQLQRAELRRVEKVLLGAADDKPQPLKVVNVDANVAMLEHCDGQR